MQIYDLTLVAQKRTISPKNVSFTVGKSIISSRPYFLF